MRSRGSISTFTSVSGIQATRVVCHLLWAGSALVAPRASEVDPAGPAPSRQSCPCLSCCRRGKHSPTWAAWGGPSRGSVTEPHHRPSHRCHGTPRGTEGPLWNLLVTERVGTAASYSSPHRMEQLASLLPGPRPPDSPRPLATCLQPRPTQPF